MRRSMIALLAALAMLAAACGASGSDDAADDATTTSSTTTEVDDTEVEEPETTTTTEADDPSGDLVEVEEWATDFCGDFETWLDGITASSENLPGSIQPGDLEGAKAAIIALFTDVSGQTQTLIGAIEATGAPDIDDGEEFHAELLGKFEQFLAAIDTARTDAEAVSTADPVTFQNTITELLSTFDQETQTVGNSFSELDAMYGDADLDAAVRSACSFM